MAHGMLELVWRLLLAACLLRLRHMECAVLPDRVLTGFSVANAGASESWLGTVAARPFLASGSAEFALAFVVQEGVFTLSVVSLQASGRGEPTAEVVWSGKRAAVENAVASLGTAGLEMRGAAGGAVGWLLVGEEGGTAGVAAMRMLDSGNLVLEDASGGVVWESFLHPTDTLLPNQNFTQAMRLTADSGRSRGCYSLAMQSDGMALSSASGSGMPWVYWEEKAMQEQRSIDASGGPIYSRLDPAGYLAMYQNETRRVDFISMRSYSVWNIPRRLKLERNGNLYAYYWDTAAGRWRVDFQAVNDVCELPSPCGRYGICSDAGTCSCPGDLASPPYKARSLNATGDPATALGCQPRAPLLCTSADSARGHALLELPGIDHVGNRFSWPSDALSLHNCKQRCLDNCSCIAAFFHNHTQLCFFHLSGEEGLGSLIAVPSGDMLGYLKVQVTSSNSPPFIPVSRAPGQNAGGKSSSHPVAVALILIVTLLSLTILLVLTGEMMWRIHRVSKERRHQTLLRKLSFSL